VEFDVALLKSYTPAVSDMLAYIQLGRQDRWKSLGRGEGREVSVLAASLAGVVKHQGVRYVLICSWFAYDRTRYATQWSCYPLPVVCSARVRIRVLQRDLRYSRRLLPARHLEAFRRRVGPYRNPHHTCYTTTRNRREAATRSQFR
jgi:hypothetical protein